MQDKSRRTHSQITFNDPGAGQYKSSYLSTLGAEARHKRPQSAGPLISSSNNTAQDGYVHGSLSTAGIAGASPAYQSLTKLEVRQIERLVADGSISHAAAKEATAAARAASPAPAADETDPGMRPKVRIRAHMNRPDLAHITSDIEGAQPNPRDVIKHPRGTNPLNPDYKLAAGTFHMPSGPPAADKFLQDPLAVSDIPGATRRPARTRSSPGAPQQLDVRDIEGATSYWKPAHRQHIGAQARDTVLNVSDINSYMARFKPAARVPVYKGHPEGPRRPSLIRPRHNIDETDNSLRTRDIEGTRSVPNRSPVRVPHDMNTSVADIEGTSPAVKDKVRLFDHKRTAAAAAAANAAAGQAILSSLSLEPTELAVLWSKCIKMDRDKSGYLTDPELESALRMSQLKLSPHDTQRLLSALKDNAGLLNYKKLTRQLKGRVSRPNSAQQQLQPQPQQAAAVTAVAAAGKPTQYVVDRMLHLQQQQQHGFSSLAPEVDTQPSRPSTAPARAQQTGISGVRPSAAAAADGVDLWFAGSSRGQVAAAAALRAWSPTHAAEQVIDNATMSRTVPVSVLQDASPAGDGGAARSTSAAGAGHVSDILPGWVVGANPVHGTCKVVQPFGSCVGTPAAAIDAAPAAPTAAVGTAVDPVGAAVAAPVSRSVDFMRMAVHRPRPASASPYVSRGEGGSSRLARPASATGIRSGSGGGSVSIVPTDLGYSVANASRPSSSALRGDLHPTAAEQAGTSSSPGLLHRPRPHSGAAAACVINQLHERSSSLAQAPVRGRSSVVLGLAEMRRLHEGLQHDLAAVRQLQ